MTLMGGEFLQKEGEENLVCFDNELNAYCINKKTDHFLEAYAFPMHSGPFNTKYIFNFNNITNTYGSSRKEIFLYAKDKTIPNRSKSFTRHMNLFQEKYSLSTEFGIIKSEHNKTNKLYLNVSRILEIFIRADSPIFKISNNYTSAKLSFYSRYECLSLAEEKMEKLSHRLL